MSNFVFAVDLGQVNDYTALCVVERVPPPAFPPGTQPMMTRDLGGGMTRTQPAPDTRKPDYHIRHLERVPLGTLYHAVVARVKGLLGESPLLRGAPLVIDQTGVGRGVYEQFGQAGLAPWGITFTGGREMRREGRNLHVPKNDLVAALLTIYQQERLQIAAGLADVPALIHELVNFRPKVNIATGHESFEAWRESDHDDLVLAAAMGVWFLENQPARPFEAFAGPPRPVINIRQ